MAKTIMIVDDAPSMRGLVAMTLRKSGYEVIEASEGRDALNKLKGKRISLIVTDLNMPVMNGIEFVKAVKTTSEHKFVPIVMLTTESEESKKQAGRNAGVKAWVVKPFKPETLLDVAKKIVG